MDEKGRAMDPAFPSILGISNFRHQRIDAGKISSNSLLNIEHHWHYVQYAMLDINGGKISVRISLDHSVDHCIVSL